MGEYYFGHHISQYDYIMESKKWLREIPFIEFDHGWLVKVCPPFNGAVIRFRVATHNLVDEGYVSVYLDCYDNLGDFGEPYWEIYPYDGGCFRCAMNETDKLKEAINKSLDDMTKEIKNDHL